MNNKFDEAPWYPKTVKFLLICLFSSFYLFNTSSASSYSLIIIALMMLIVCLIFTGGKIKLAWNRYFTVCFAFSLFSFCSTIWAWNSDYALEKGITIFEITVCMMIISICLDADNRINRIGLLTDVVLWAGNIIAIYVLSTLGIDGIRSFVNGGNRLNVEFAGLNATAILMAITIVLTIQKFFDTGWKWKYLITFLPIVLLALFESRTAIIEIAIGMVVVLYYRIKSAKGSNKIVRFLLCVMAAYVIVIAFLNLDIFSAASQRFLRGISTFLGGTEYDNSALLRQKMSMAGWEQFLKTPLLGIGIGNGRIIGESVSGWDCYLHNNYSELLVDGGLVGFLIFYSLHFKIIYTTIKSMKRGVIDNDTICALVVATMLMAGDIGTVTYYAKDTYFLLLMGYDYVLRYKKRTDIDATDT